MEAENLSESSKHNAVKTNVLSADSGLSEDDFSIISEVASEFSLLEISSGKDNDEKGKIEQGSSLSGAERSIGEQNIHRSQEFSSLENTGTHGQSVEKKDIAKKASSSSSTNDFSILDLPEKDLEENDVEEDSDAKNILDNLVILPVGTKKDSQPSSMGSLISCNRPGDSNNHESSVLGSSFAVIDTSDKSSSYPTSFDISVDRSKIKVLPPKEDTEISKSIDEHENKVTKKKSMCGGIVEVVDQREDWKLKEEEKPNIGAVETVEDLTDSEQMQNYDKNKDMQDQIVQGTETVTDVDPVVKETDTTQSDICQYDGKDCNNHESSVLFSSFADIYTSDKSSSYPSSFDIIVDRSKIKVIPHKEDTEISTTIDEHGNKVTKKKIMRGGIVKVVQREEKPNIGAVETVEDLTDSERTKNYDKNKDMQYQIVQGTETVTDVDPVVKETDTTQSDICQNNGKRDEVKVENSMDTEMVTDRNKADKTKTQEHYDVRDDTGSLSMSTSQKDEEKSTKGEINDVERKDQGEITDVERRNRQKYLDKDEILGEQQIEGDKEIQVVTQNNQGGTNFVPDKDSKSMGAFSVVDKSEFSENDTSRKYGKSDVDSDILSSNSETRSRSSTISINMDELEIDTSDESSEPRTRSETSGESGNNGAEIAEKQRESVYSDMVVQKEENSSIGDFSLLDKSELDTDSSVKILTNEIQQTGEEEDKPVITKEDEKEIRSRSVSDASTASSVSPEVWQPSQGFRMITEDEEILEKRLKKQHALQVHLRYSFEKSRSHESEMKTFEIKMENVLEWTKWEYVLSRKDQLLVKRFPDTRFNFDESYGKLELVLLKSVEDEEKVKKWYSEVMEEVKRQIKKIDNCIICCLQEKIEGVLSQLKGICAAAQLDADVEFSQQRVALLNDENMNENVIVVTGNLGNITTVLLEMDVNSVRLYHYYQGHLVSLTLHSIPLNTIQHDVFVKFEAERVLITQFPDVHVKMLSNTLKLFVKEMYVEQVLSFINEKCLKFKHVSKITLKPLEFTLLCKASVKNYIVMDKLQSSENDYKWTFFPRKGEIILYAENQQQSDEIKDSIFSSFKEHKIKLDNVQMVDVRKADEWVEIVKDVQERSKGMVEISLNDDQTVVTIIGTDDIMTAWGKYGTLDIIEKDILKITGKSKAHPLEEVELMKKIVTMDCDNLNAVHRQKMIDIQETCKKIKVELVSTDIGFEVIGAEESLVNDIYERLMQVSHEVVKTEHNFIFSAVKRFVQMEEQEIDLVYNKKKTDLESYSKELEVEFDITNLGYEVKGKTESNVKKFCDFLIEMKQETSHEKAVLANKLQDGGPEMKQETIHRKAVLASEVQDGGPLSCTKSEDDGDNSVLEQKLVKKFVQLDDSIIQFIEKFKMVELQEIMTNLEQSDCCSTNLGFEVSGLKDIDVLTLCDHLKHLNSQIETRKLEIPSKLSEGDIQKLEQKYKCIVKLLDDTDQATDDTDEAVWYINGVKMSVSVKDSEEITCDVIITPMDEKQIEANQKFIYQEKQISEEVNIPAPHWTQESGKEKHMLNDLFFELLEELDKKSYSIVALPVLGFNGWPPVKLTKVMVLSLSKFCLKVNRCNIQKIILYSTDTNVCVKVINAIEDALPSLKREGLDVGHIKKSNMALLSVSTECNSTPEMLAKQQPQVKTDISSAASESEPHMEVHTTDDNHQPLPTPVEVKIAPDIFIMKGQIARQKVDAIVNTTSPDFDLKNGAVSKSILDAAGKNIQKEIKANAHKRLKGEIVITKGHNLKCKAVFHGSLEGYDEKKRSAQQKSVELLNRFVTSCLYEAHKRNFNSIAFPALGTGVLDFPPDVVATEMMKMIEEFRNNYPRSRLSEIRIVIYRDEGIYMIFQKITDDFKESLMRSLSKRNATAPVKPPVALNMSAKDKPPVAVDPPKDINTLVGPDLPTQGISLDVGRISLSAGLGDVTKLEGFDCLILLWPQDEIFSTPADKKIILQSVGHSSIKQWETGRDTLSYSKVLVTPGGGLPQKTIIHVYVDNYRLHEAFVLGLTKAEELKMLSVVIPVRPSDLLAKDVEVFSTCIFRAVTENCYRFNMIRHVRICIGGRHLCQPILATLAKLQEIEGSQNESKKETTVCTIQITALTDDMASIMAEIKPQADVVEDIAISEDIEVKDKTLTKDDIEIEVKDKTLTKDDIEIEVKDKTLTKDDIEIEVKDKTLTKDDIEQYTKSPSELLVNVRAEISPDVIDAVRQRNQLSLMKSTIERSSEQVKVREDDGKWSICMPSPSHIEMCQKSIHQFWENFLNDKSDLQGEELNDPSGETVGIKIELTKDLFQAIMLLEKRKLSEIIGNAKIRCLEKSGSLEITGQAMCKNGEQKIKTLISNFQTNMTMDVVEVAYRQLKETTPENFVIKLQTEYPDVYIYIEEGNGAEASFSVYFVSLNRESLSSVKRGIQTKYLKTTNRAGRFTQSQYKDKNTNHQSRGNFSQSFSLPDRNPKPRNFRTMEGLQISVYMADIRKLSVDCIVNAANGQLMHGGGIAAVIADAAGPTFNKECSDYVKSYGEIKTGECCVTNAGNLPYKRVIHGVGPQWSRRNANECCDLLQKTIEQCIEMANKIHMKSVAIPSISAGLYGMPLEVCARSYVFGVMTVSAKKTSHWSLQEIHFVDNKPDMVLKVQTAFSEILENAGTPGQKSVKEHFQSLTSVNQIRGSETILKKVNEMVSKNEANPKNETFVAQVPTTATVVRSHGILPSNEENTQTVQQPCRFTINQSLHQQGSFPGDKKLPSLWHVTVKNNLMEIKADHSFKVLIYEHDFGKLQMESIAFGQDTDYRTSSLIKSMGSTSTFKPKLKQLKVQLPKPNIGTIAAFEIVSGNYAQNVFIVFTPKYRKESSLDATRKFRHDLYGCYLKLFFEAVNTPEVEYLAVSFLKTGSTAISFEEGANIFFQAINTFSTGRDPHCTLKQVHLILNKSTSAFKAIQSVLEKNFDGRGHLVRTNERVNKRDLLIIGSKLINSKDNGNVMPADDKSETENVEEKTPVTTEKSQPETCAICLEEVQDDNKKILLKCKHEFCKDCINVCFQHKPVCPTCGTVYGIVRGNQPTGTMRVEHKPHVHLPGYSKKGHHVITYCFHGGTQTDEHHNPGMHYRGTYRVAYLPANEKGTLVLKLLKIAFDRKLVFTIGHSRTTGEENVVTWNDIHHKTNMVGGAQGFGYPDPQYLDRVLEELAAKGISEADL